MIMTVDTGNKMIKTDTLEFNAGVEILDQMPGEREEIISYEGQYYITTSRRISYMEDKTEDERYFILTLFAIGKELEAMETQERMIPNGLIEIELLVGLPPAHYGKHRRTFREYFQREGDIINFTHKNTPYKIAFSEVKVYIQAYAAVFVGGGSILLSDFIQEVWKRYQGEYFIINDPKANAKGYKLQYLAEKKELEAENEQTGSVPV